jgi:hypothetical protein
VLGASNSSRTLTQVAVVEWPYVYLLMDSPCPCWSAAGAVQSCLFFLVLVLPVPSCAHVASYPAVLHVHRLRAQGVPDGERAALQNSVNPKFIPRQHLLQVREWDSQMYASSRAPLLLYMGA